MFLILAGSDRDQLAQQIQYLKVENEILRSILPRRIKLTRTKKARLIKYGRPIVKALKELITIVTHRTFTRWLQREKEEVAGVIRKPGRPRTSEDTREMIYKMAKENDNWGYTRIMGELKKLLFPKVGRTTVQNILTEAGFDPSPDRSRSTWYQFIERHAKTLWACDFFSTKVWTIGGRFDCYVLVFIHPESRRVLVSPSTFHPNRSWVAQQARNFLIHLDDLGLKITHLIRDRDSKYARIFDRIMQSEGIWIKRLPIRSPNLNAFAERFIHTIKHECLGHFVAPGRKHFDYLVNEFVDYYHRRRPHQGVGNKLLFPDDKEESCVGKIGCEKKLGGLLKHYYRKAA